MKDLKVVKRKLTVIFTVIVFLLLVFLSIIFFSVKYANSFIKDTEWFNNLSHWLVSNNISIKEFIDRWNQADNSFWPKNKQNIKKQDDTVQVKWFINVIHIDDENNILNKLIKEDLTSYTFDFDDIINNKKYSEVRLNWDFLILRLDKLNWEKIILIKKVNYSFNDYLADQLSFVFIVLLFSLWLYFIGLKFINKVMVPVEENIADMTDFVHNAWHELKTPLSVMDSNIQLMKNLKTYDEEMTIELKNEVIKLNSLIDWLINLSNIDSFKNPENVNLYEILEDIVNCFNKQITKNNISIKIKIDKELTIYTNKNNLYILLSNIIWNAIKYNKEWWKVSINYKSWILSVKDNWIWIDNENLEKIFNRFFKEDKSRNTEWFGIWLALVKKISNIYWWKINVESEVWNWTKFNITLK